MYNGPQHCSVSHLVPAPSWPCCGLYLRPRLFRLLLTAGASSRLPGVWPPVLVAAVTADPWFFWQITAKFARLWEDPLLSSSRPCMVNHRVPLPLGICVACYPWWQLSDSSELADTPQSFVMPLLCIGCIGIGGATESWAVLKTDMFNNMFHCTKMEKYIQFGARLCQCCQIVFLKIRFSEKWKSVQNSYTKHKNLCKLFIYRGS